MPSERVQRQIDRLLDEAEQAIAASDWALVQARCEQVLRLDPDNADAPAYLAAAAREPHTVAATLPTPEVAPPPALHSALPASFAAGRYEVQRFLGEGGKKQVYLAHDSLLDRDVAVALLKTEGLDEAGRQRLRREAQAMARLGSHAHIVPVFDLGEEDGRPYLVTEFLPGGDLEAAVAGAPDRRLPLERVLAIGHAVCRALAFAHGHHIVHRDLKPGNVWLTADGTAKIGDFGLAVVLERSRITQAGLMVGTVAYLPPEQALGGAVTPRSDLYALGATLYELVTGRPPFVGDDTVAILTQHLNVAPVAPSWHRPDCPPALEALILALLEKDPARRPASADVVEAALAAVDLAPPTPAVDSANAVPAGADTLSPVYRRAFVGREAELRELRSAFDAALSGQGGLALVVGEPGIGKTSLCEQLGTYAVLRGGHVLVGHCYEEGSLSLPYLPFVEALRGYVLTHESGRIRAELGSGAPDVARIVSEVRERLQVAPRPPADPDADRYRLLQAVATFLRNAANVQPLVLVLEDLHDADQGTLDLLRHLARSLAGTRLLVVGTYRDVEVDRAHPLAATLATLRRSESFSRVALRGLAAEEVQRMLGVIATQDVSWGLAQAVHRQTEGNPLFVQEVVRYLVEEGLIRREDGRWRAAAGELPLAQQIPEGLRDVIGRRLARLSGECNRLLAVAAVIGREFGLETLRTVAAVSDDVLDGALEEAVRIAVLEERVRPGAVGYRFTHAFFRQALYEEIIAPRRLRLHQQVARALEAQYAARPGGLGGRGPRPPEVPQGETSGQQEGVGEPVRFRNARLSEHASELAEHFSHSTDAADLARAVEYGELAARRAIAVYAYGEAVRLLEQALQVQEVLDPDDGAKRCDLLLAQAGALVAANEPRRVLAEVAPLAFALAETLSDAARASQVCRAALYALQAFGEASAFGTAEGALWAGRADRYAEPETASRAMADLLLGVVRHQEGDLVGAAALFTRALELARRLDDPDALWWAAATHMTLLAAPHHEGAKLRLAEEFAARSRVGLNPRMLSSALVTFANIFLCVGRRAQAEALFDDQSELARQTGQPRSLQAAMANAAVLRTLDGELGEAVVLGEHILAQDDDQSPTPAACATAARASVRALLYLGDAEVANRLASCLPSPFLHPLTLAHVGRRDEAAALLERLVIERPGVGTPDDEASIAFDALYLEAAVLTEHREAMRLLVRRLGTSSLIATGSLTIIARHLGAAAALLGDRDEALIYSRRALEQAEALPFRPEAALTHLQLAELLADGNEQEQAEAREHLAACIPELRDMQMQPGLERALRLRERLAGTGSGQRAAGSAVTPPQPTADVTPARALPGPSFSAERRLVTVLFTDIVRSTERATELGDRAWRRLKAQHHAVVRRELARFRGHEVDTAGDGFFATFDGPARAVRCACAIRDAVRALGLEIRAGLHLGEVEEQAGTLSGLTVHVGARVAALAGPSEVLVSQTVKDLVAGSGLRFADRGRHALKGVPGEWTLFAVDEA